MNAELCSVDLALADQIQSEFATLWHSKINSKTLEISTPYKLPGSTLFTLMITTRDDRWIACDGGHICEILSDLEYLDGAALIQLRKIAEEHSVKMDDSRGDSQGYTIFYKDTKSPKCIGSIAFDICTFAMVATHIIASK